MFQAMFSPTIRSAWLYLQYLAVFNQVVAGWRLEWVETHSRQQPAATWVKIQSCAPDGGRKHRPKHVQLTWNNKLIYIVHLVGYFHNFITMHGFMNIKCCTISILFPMKYQVFQNSIFFGSYNIPILHKGFTKI